jgi:hypothetical protein
MGFATFAAIRTALDAGQTERAYYIKPSVAALQTTLWMSTWSLAGLPAAGANPGATGTPTTYSNDASSLNFRDRVGQTKYVTRLSFFPQGSNVSFGAGGAYVFYDRLVGVGSISAAAGSPAVNTPVLPRYATGYGVRAWIETTTQTGTATFTATYTNSDGTGSRTSGSVVIGAHSDNGICIPIPLAAGDIGVRSVQSLTITGTGVGNWNLILYRPIFYSGVYYNRRDNPGCEVNFVRDRLSLPEIFDGASLSFAQQANNQTTALIAHRGFVEIIYV